MNPLFACSRCFKRYPFEEIFTTANDDMFCRDCRNATAKNKCAYCRSEYPPSKQTSSTCCPKCASNLKMYGKPRACSLCSLSAAFKTDKCLRCTSSEYKFGPAVKCEICMQTSAFNREDHRVDGKLHCWLCKASYKRALAKAKKSDSDKTRNRKRSAEEANMKSNSSHKITSGSSNNRGNHNAQRPDVSKSGLSEIPEKISKTGNSAMIPSNSDHVVAMTQLKEQIATLQKRLQQKDNQLLQKDKEITEWKSRTFTIEQEMRNKMKEQEKIFESKLDVMNKKIQNQLKEIAQLSKVHKRNERIALKESAKIEKENSSGTDSPVIN